MARGTEGTEELEAAAKELEASLVALSPPNHPSKHPLPSPAVLAAPCLSASCPAGSTPCLMGLDVRLESDAEERAWQPCRSLAQLKKAEALAEKGQAIAQRTGQWLKKRLSDRNLDRGERAELESIGRRFEAAGRRFEEVSRKIIDQRYLPHQFVIEDICNHEEMAIAIKDMHVRGAGLIGAAAGYGMFLAALKAPKTSPEEHLTFVEEAGLFLKSTRPTAVNLEFAVERQLSHMKGISDVEERVRACREMAGVIADEDAQFCSKIGQHGVTIIEEIYKKKGAPVNILTHCNAGWLAFVDVGSATAPIYEAHNRNIPIHVYVDETRPPEPTGASLTAWELSKHGVKHTIIADNSFRFVALPSSTFDWTRRDGVKEIPIESRNENEVKFIQGLHQESGKVLEVLLCPAESPAANYAFDVTPARLLSGLITERGVCRAEEQSILELFPEKK
ncbi:hypothetical protein GUITHDRAFT_144876 [Guillardia theta CCMP2712]|uniref:S-methyl-5-thioribose-1-phosphate isomerase n=1 Tax=Guillardia theta (strain CCMP2712) TaxID=905079 RepID=L1INX9_GUITC|nr:hypothetical protein GUITHDRAFT_144876 [Guillardia theta CCMP2712]EKX37599.1 hypothetical protein GUITHDRAFT_144876 [Guillardia theta CCMP2712]|eukprot:XP_005824579.1 hypothetical protein GUITHDRAFT_144876 [Guillardia theta CCMP2712]